MEDENLDLDQEPNVDREDQRNKTLSKKVIETAKERDEMAAAKAQEETEKNAALKERDFYKDFSSQTSKYPAASEYQDAIKEKVMSGYSVDDATVAVLAREGKFTAPAPEPIKVDSPAGGSASNTIQSGGDKTIAEMDQAERRAILEKNLEMT